MNWRARVSLGNDSGTSNRAANMDIPCVVFFTITDPAQWAQWVLRHQIRIVDLRGQNLRGLDIGKELGRVRTVRTVRVR
jgi:ADP-heptose:LPS heptosyltransferase